MSRESRIVNELRQAGFTVLTRKQWGSRQRARYQTRRVTRHFVGAADHAFAHITVTRDDGPLIGEFKADMREVERIGLERFGTGFPYNWGVDQDTGTIALGMPHDAAGAHTVNDKNIGGFPNNLNYWGHAIAWIGMPYDSISDKAIDAYAAIIAAEKKHGAMKAGASLYPHSKFAWKDCPCDQVRNKIPYIMKTSRSILGQKEEKDPMPSIKDIWDSRISDLVPNLKPAPGHEKNEFMRPKWALAHARRDSYVAMIHARQANAKMDALAQALDKQLPGVAKAAADAAEKAVQDALAEGIEITVSAQDAEGN